LPQRSAGASAAKVAGASGYSANPFRVRWQLETRENPERRNEYCRSLIKRKIEATIITLEKINSPFR
jgi:hypothetical protein